MELQGKRGQRWRKRQNSQENLAKWKENTKKRRKTHGKPKKRKKIQKKTRTIPKLTSRPFRLALLKWPCILIGDLAAILMFLFDVFAGDVTLTRPSMGVVFITPFIPSKGTTHHGSTWILAESYDLKSLVDWGSKRTVQSQSHPFGGSNDF